jgi:hypothetical protein
MIKFRCQCGQKVGVSESHSGKRALCPRCGLKIEIPMETTVFMAMPNSGSRSSWALLWAIAVVSAFIVAGFGSRVFLVGRDNLSPSAATRIDQRPTGAVQSLPSVIQERVPAKLPEAPEVGARAFLPIDLGIMRTPRMGSFNLVEASGAARDRMWVWRDSIFGTQVAAIGLNESSVESFEVSEPVKDDRGPMASIDGAAGCFAVAFGSNELRREIFRRWESAKWFPVAWIVGEMEIECTASRGRSIVRACVPVLDPVESADARTFLPLDLGLALRRGRLYLEDVKKIDGGSELLWRTADWTVQIRASGRGSKKMSRVEISIRLSERGALDDVESAIGLLAEMSASPQKVFLDLSTAWKRSFSAEDGISSANMSVAIAVENGTSIVTAVPSE